MNTFEEIPYWVEITKDSKIITRDDCYHRISELCGKYSQELYSEIVNRSNWETTFVD